MERLHYPEIPTVEQVVDYHGTLVLILTAG